MSGYERLRVAFDGSTAEILLNRPEKKNALDPMLHAEMFEALTEVESHDGVKALVVTGAGDSFCAGMDLEKCFFEPFEDSAEFERVNEVAQRWFRRYQAFRVPTIAKINGYCFGGGIEIVAMSDIAVAVKDAQFGLSEINFGTFPGGGTTWAVAHTLPRKWALYYILTGERFTGEEAARIGLVNFAVPATELDDVTDRITGSLATKNVHALRAAKETYEGVLDRTFSEAINWEMAKLYELTYISRDDWIDRGLGQFRRREYRPGMEAYRLKEGQ